MLRTSSWFRKWFTENPFVICFNESDPLRRETPYLCKAKTIKKGAKFEAKCIDILKVIAIWLQVVIKSSFLLGKVLFGVERVNIYSFFNQNMPFLMKLACQRRLFLERRQQVIRLASFEQIIHIFKAAGDHEMKALMATRKGTKMVPVASIQSRGLLIYLTVVVFDVLKYWK